MFIALALTYFTGTLPLGDVLKGFASGTVWMIFSAYVLSLGFVQSGLGKRIAYKMLSIFGGSSLGVAYSLGIADLITVSPSERPLRIQPQHEARIGRGAGRSRRR